MTFCVYRSIISIVNKHKKIIMKTLTDLKQQITEGMVEYHIIDGNNTKIAKFTSSKIRDAWKKFNKRCCELLENKKDIPSCKSFGNLAWTGNLKKDHTIVTLRLAKVTVSGYVLGNTEAIHRNHSTE